MTIELRWPQRADAAHHVALHRIAHDVAALGGAVGWLEPPDEAESRAWVDRLMAGVASGDAAVCVAEVDGVAQAVGAWERDQAPVFRQRAQLTRIMAHPDARGLGLGRRIVDALVKSAEDAGLEQLHLGVRGNNHLAIALYHHAGFVEWGRCPDAIAIGSLRFDDVRMVRRLDLPAGVVSVGSAPEGPGSSPAPDRRPARRPAPPVSER